MFSGTKLVHRVLTKVGERIFEILIFSGFLVTFSIFAGRKSGKFNQNQAISYPGAGLPTIEKNSSATTKTPKKIFFKKMILDLKHIQRGASNSSGARRTVHKREICQFRTSFQDSFSQSRTVWSDRHFPHPRTPL